MDVLDGDQEDRHQGCSSEPGDFAFQSVRKRGDVAERRRYPCIACGPNAQNDFDVEVEDDEERAWAVRDDLKLAMVNKCPHPPPQPLPSSHLPANPARSPVLRPPSLRTALPADLRKVFCHKGRRLPRIIATAGDAGTARRESFLSLACACVPCRLLWVSSPGSEVSVNRMNPTFFFVTLPLQVVVLESPLWQKLCM